MLRLITGKAGAGKTAAVIKEISRAVGEKQDGRLLIVPEQYSHEAERELCAACGDSLSLYAEVFSFTGLARRVMSRMGGGAEKYLDKGGRLLCMALALNHIGPRLKVYTAARGRAELQAMLLSAVDELKTACISPEQLEAAAESCEGGLGDKLRDLALIAGAYEAVAANGRADPADRLSVLAGQIGECWLGPDSHVYVDGFVDFTQQEHRVLYELMKKGVQLTVCLTVDELDGSNEIFALSRRACRRLLKEAAELNVESRTVIMDRSPDKAPALGFFADNMFSYATEGWQGGPPPVSLLSAESISAECELAAARAIELVRGGCRWRDIAVAVRGFEDYRGTLESVFRHYGVPLFTARRSALLTKPLPSLIAGAYDILEGGWDVDDVIGYLRTGLTGLSTEDCDLLADYIYKWQLRAGAWERRGDWRQHPDGYGGEYDEAAEERLRRINQLRQNISQPLHAFKRRCDESETAEGQAAALAVFLEELHLPETLEQRADELEHTGRPELSQEYRQLWELIVSAIEQSAAILGDVPMDMASFGRLFLLMLSQYDIGTIPVSLDRVSAGDFDRMRRRSIKHLIVLGCSDERLPKAADEAGMFSEEERRRLLELEIDLGGGESELWREFSLIYHCLTLPSESLAMSYPLCGGDGDSLRPAFVFSRAAALFSLKPLTGELDNTRLSAPAPALTLAANAVKGGSPAATAAAEYFRHCEPERFARLEAAADMSRGSLSPRAVEALYGSNLRLSASRADKFSACKFAYFCQYGLKARPYEPAGFTPPEIGSFMHYVLENTAREVKARGGFAAVSDETLHKLTEQYVQAYVHEELNDFQEKSRRFIYLFKRLGADVHQVVADMAAELRRSDFEPLDFELDFSGASDLPPLELEEAGEQLALTGVADRVDGWLHEGKLYLRIVDYKTGRKKFSLSDIWYGMGMQMLMYLFTLQAGGRGRYGHEIVPAGVMYLPARNALLSLTQDMDDGEAEKKRSEALRRSGLVLDDGALIEAWEKGEDKRYIPVKFKGGKPAADSLATLERMGVLAGHIKKSLGQMAGELRRGSIGADPYYRSQQENACLNCKYFDVCHFGDGENGESCRFMPKLSDNRAWSLMEGEAEHE